MKFRTRDWLDNKELRRCSPVARSVLIDLMALAHEGVPYGVLSDKSGALSDSFMASRCVMTVGKFRASVKELETHTRVYRSLEGLLAIPQMVDDERRRLANEANGRRGGNPGLTRSINSGDKGMPLVHSRATRIARAGSGSSEVSPEGGPGETEPWSAAGFSGPDDFESWWNEVVSNHPNKNYNSRARMPIFELIIAGRFSRERFDSGYAKLMEANRVDWTKERGKYCTNLLEIVENRLYEFVPSQPVSNQPHYETPEEREERITREDAARRSL